MDARGPTDRPPRAAPSSKARAAELQRTVRRRLADILALTQLAHVRDTGLVVRFRAGAAGIAFGRDAWSTPGLWPFCGGRAGDAAKTVVWQEGCEGRLGDLLG